jgi:rfaE bifunctional protein nucleotidyltransferase chain/domain
MAEIITYPQAVQRAVDMHLARVQFAFTNGCFDILHVGHTRLLKAAESIGPVFVAVNDDHSITKSKGHGRPIYHLPDRMELVAAVLGPESYVFSFSSQTVRDIILTLSPSVWIKGGDYTLETLDKGEVEAARACECGIEIFAFYPGRSTTETIKRICAT